MANAGSNIPYLADLWSTVETSHDPNAEYLQMEVNTFNDMKRRGYLPADAQFSDYVKMDKNQRKISNKANYENMTVNFYNYMQDVYGAQTPEQAALFAYRPGYIKKYGTVENVPPGLPGSFGKDSKTVLQQRLDSLNAAGYTQ